MCVHFLPGVCAPIHTWVSDFLVLLHMACFVPDMEDFLQHFFFKLVPNL